MSGISGDHAKLAAWQRRLENTAGIPQRAAAAVAPLFTAEIKGCFANETDPYGNSWKPDKPATYQRGTGAILDRTGKLLASVAAAATGARVKSLLGMAYVRFHISTGRGPLPKSGKIPPKWSEIIKAEVTKAFQEILAGK